jgi:hypothetical protein
VSRDDETHGPAFGGYNDLLLERRDNLFVFILFFQFEFTDFLHSIFQDEESLWQEEVEAAELEADLEAAELEETSDGGGQYFEEEEDEEDHKEEEGHEEGAGLDDEGVVVLLQDPHPHTDLGVATSFALL